jgi:hypothetical protein
LELALAGCPFVVEPDSALAPFERVGLEALALAGAAPARDVPPFRFALVDEAPWPGADPAGYPDHAAADVRAVRGRLRVAHRRLLAEIDLEALAGRVRRPTPEDGAVEIALRVALCARLPSLGLLPLHAAGLVLDGAGIAFFGPSGAGKSTLAGLAPGTVISDELVAVAAEPATLFPTGFFGEIGRGRGIAAPAQLAALVELGRGAVFRLERLAADQAFRRLLGVILAPPLPRAWSDAMALAGRVTREVPVYRMEWAPEDPPWDRLRAALLSA